MSSVGWRQVAFGSSLCTWGLLEEMHQIPKCWRQLLRVWFKKGREETEGKLLIASLPDN